MTICMLNCRYKQGNKKTGDKQIEMDGNPMIHRATLQNLLSWITITTLLIKFPITLEEASETRTPEASSCCEFRKASNAGRCLLLSAVKSVNHCEVTWILCFALNSRYLLTYYWLDLICQEVICPDSCLFYVTCVSELHNQTSREVVSKQLALFC